MLYTITDMIGGFYVFFLCFCYMLLYVCFCLSCVKNVNILYCLFFTIFCLFWSDTESKINTQFYIFCNCFSINHIVWSTCHFCFMLHTFNISHFLSVYFYVFMYVSSRILWIMFYISCKQWTTTTKNINNENYNQTNAASCFHISKYGMKQFIFYAFSFWFTKQFPSTWEGTFFNITLNNFH